MYNYRLGVKRPRRLFIIQPEGGGGGCLKFASLNVMKSNHSHLHSRSLFTTGTGFAVDSTTRTEKRMYNPHNPLCELEYDLEVWKGRLGTARIPTLDDPMYSVVYQAERRIQDLITFVSDALQRVENHA